PQVKQVEQLQSVLLNRLFLCTVTSRPQHGTRQPLATTALPCQTDVIQNAHAGEQPNILKCASNSGGSNFMRFRADEMLRFQHNSPAVGLINAGEQIEHASLARPVGPNQPV